MGREALIYAEAGSDAGEVRVLLESSELVLRGQVRRKFPRDRIEGVRVADGLLIFECDGEEVSLHLGPRASSWADAIATPPPTLRDKLGLARGAKALLVGELDDQALTDAVGPSLVDDPAEASLLVARIRGTADVQAVIEAEARLPGTPVWMIYGKGSGVRFGDAQVRIAMRAAGFRDSKSSAVSERLTATRYGRPRS